MSDDALHGAVQREAKRMGFWLDLFAYGACGVCGRTWDVCRCEDRDERFKARFDERWAEIESPARSTQEGEG